MDNLPAIIWFVIGLVLILAEFGMPGLIIVFFGIGAWIVSGAIYLGLADTLQIQLIIFGVTSIALLVGLRRFVKDKFYGHVSSTQDLDVNLDEFTGKQVLVLKDVIPGQPGGQVELKGANWQAVSEEHFKAGDTAIVAKLDGLTLQIKRPEEK